MTITEMIEQLEELREKHGDLPVYADHDVSEIEIAKYGFESMVQYIYIRGVRSSKEVRICIDD